MLDTPGVVLHTVLISGVRGPSQARSGKLHALAVPSITQWRPQVQPVFTASVDDYNIYGLLLTDMCSLCSLPPTRPADERPLPERRRSRARASLASKGPTHWH